MNVNLKLLQYQIRSETGEIISDFESVLEGWKIDNKKIVLS